MRYLFFGTVKWGTCWFLHVSLFRRQYRKSINLRATGTFAKPFFFKPQFEPIITYNTLNYGWRKRVRSLFDPSMSALPINVKENSQATVGLKVVEKVWWIYKVMCFWEWSEQPQHKQGNVAIKEEKSTRYEFTVVYIHLYNCQSLRNF